MKTWVVLNFLKSKVLVHRDIKPSNVLLIVRSQNDVVGVISDVGIWKKTKEGDATMMGLYGSIGWMAPELENNNGNSLSFTNSVRNKKQ